MRDLHLLDRYRVSMEPQCVPPGMDPRGDAKNGWFLVPLSTETGMRLAGSKPGETLRIIAASGGGWDHVSVSLPDRVPSWEEMKLVHRLFFNENEVAWQYHVPNTDHINCHPYCLHMWRKLGFFRMPMPPKEYV